MGIAEQQRDARFFPVFLLRLRRTEGQRKRNLASRSFEIFAMVVEAMCGLILGASILFPKTLSRFNSFKSGFKDSFKIF
jgi:hypothetical protein